MSDFDTTKKRAPATRRRRRGAGAIVFLVLAMIAGLVVVAVNAEGRELSRTNANDGGAWVVSRDHAAVAHQNRATGELSTFVRLTDSPTADVHQASDVVVVHDAASNLLFEVDPRSSTEDLAPTRLPEFTEVLATDGAVIVYRTTPLAVWRVPSQDLGALASLQGRPPLVDSSEPGVIAVTATGEVAAVETESGIVHWFDGDIRKGEALDLDIDGVVIDVSIVGASLAVLTDAGELIIVGPEGVEHVVDWAEVAPTAGTPVLLQKSAVSVNPASVYPATSVAIISETGDLVEVTLLQDASTASILGRLDGSGPVAPIAHEGCFYAVVTNPPTYGAVCDAWKSELIDGAGSQLRLRLVNGWIWINDVETGTSYSPDADLQLEVLDDWGPVIDAAVEDEDDPEDAPAAQQPLTEDTIIIDDPDAEGDVQNSDDFDPSEVNLPPIAVDDEAETRADRATVVDVLNNDSDPNNDVLAVIEVEVLSGEGVVEVTPAGTATQVIPAAGFTGVLEYRYAISDGRSDPVSATVTMQVLPNETNRAPIAETDVVPATPGQPQTVNVLTNDYDPDGDAIFVTAMSVDTGALRWDPSGLTTYTPDSTTDTGWVEISYVIADGFGAEADGRVRVEIRDDEANQEPDARNDQLTTVVGKPVSANILENDFDPDGDALVVGSQPRLVEPEGAVVRTSTTPDGEFVFASDEPGTYIFTYTVNDAAADGSESDTARIRVDVLPAEQNQPPIAVRDDVVIPVGESRPVRVLENDGDPDGDVIAIVNWQVSPGVLVSEIVDETGHVGFDISLTNSAGSTPEMTYAISDGINPPVSASVVIAVATRTPTNQPPLAADDVEEGRPGQQFDVAVMVNDFDPEGEPLEIVSVGETDLATVEVAPDGSVLVVFIPEDAVSSFSVPYDIQDPAGNRASAILRVQLINPAAANRPPIARTDTQRTSIATPVIIDVLANDSDPDSDPIALAGIIEQPANGTTQPNLDGSIVYTPDPLFRGTDVFAYTIVDAAGDSAIGQVFVGVLDEAVQNQPPIANDDAELVTGGTETPIRVLANDLDPDGDPIRIVDVSSATLGTVTFDGQTVTYTPPPSMDEPATDTFTYVIADSAGNQDDAVVTINLEAYEDLDIIVPAPVVEPTPEPTPEAAAPEPEPTPTTVAPTPTPTPSPTPEAINVPPVARDDNPPPAKAGTEITVDVLANDFDPDGEFEELSIQLVGSGARIDGDFVTIEVGEEARQISYTIVDRLGAEATAVINVLVIANRPPLTTPIEATTEFETAVILDIGAQVSDPDDDPLFFVCCDNVRGGSAEVVVAAENELQIRFIPATDFDGSAGFSYTVDDQQGHRVAGSASIIVGAPDNRPPETLDDVVDVQQRSLALVDLARLVTDPDGDQLSYSATGSSDVAVVVTGSVAEVSVVSGVAVGTTGSFTYEASDGLLSATGRIDYRVTEGENRPPVVTDAALNVRAATSETIDLAEFTVEPDLGDSVTWTIDTPGSAGVTVELSGSLATVRADADASGTDLDIAFTASDTRGGADSGVLAISVVDTTVAPPTAVDDTGGRGGPEEAIEIDVLNNDVDPLGEGLTLTSIDPPTFGTMNIVQNRVVFIAGDGETGTASSSYTMIDAADRESTATVSVEIVSAPNRPAPPEAVAASGQVTISWETPQLNGATLTGYRITPTPASAGAPFETGVTNSHVWTGLDNGTEYSFTITALSDLGESAESDSSPAVTPNQIPEPPAVSSVTFQDSALYVEWQEPTNLGSEITDYEIRIGGNISDTRLTSGLTEFTWDQLANGDNYTFELRAENDAGWSDWGPSSTPEHPAGVPDAPIIGLSSRTQESGALEVTWGKPVSDNGDEIIEYFVEYFVDSASGGPPVPVTGEDTLSMEWADLTNGVAVQFRVQARNRAGLSDWSALSNEVIPCGRPDAPAVTGAVRGDQLASVTWDAPAQNGCNIIRYWVSAVGSAQEFETSALSYDYTGLANGTAYTFTIQAENEQGRSVLSAESPQVIPAGPPIFCPTSGTASASATGVGEITASWDAAIANGDPAGVTYEVRIDGGGWQPASPALGVPTTHVAGGLTEDTTSSFEVRAVNTVDVSPTVCGPATARTWARPSPMTIVVSYDTQYQEIFWRTGGGASPDTPVTSSSYTLSQDGILFEGPFTSPAFPIGSTQSRTASADGLYGGTTQVCNAVGCVDGVGNEVSVVVPKPPETPTEFQIEMWGSVSWTPTWDRLGARVWVQVVNPDTSTGGGIPTHYEYELERNDTIGGPFSVIETGVIDYGSEAGGSTTGSLFTLFGHFGEVLGYSSHPQGVNQGNSYTWRIRVKAVNDVGESDWSPWGGNYTWWATGDDWVPTIEMDLVQSVRCNDGGTGPNTSHCMHVDVSMYGFPPFGSYDFAGSYVNGTATPGYSYLANDSSGGLFSGCGGVVNLDANGINLFGSGTQTIVGQPFQIYCSGPIGAQFRLVTVDGYFSPWQPGE